MNMANPDQTASEEAVWSGSSLSALLTNIVGVRALKTKILFLRTEREEFKTSEHYHRPFWMQQSQGPVYHENIEDTQTTMEQVTAIQVTCILQNKHATYKIIFTSSINEQKASHFSACLEVLYVSVF